MKFIHFSDVHGDLDALRSVLDYASSKDLELMVCSGDLGGECLSDERAKQMVEAYGFLSNLYNGDGRLIPFGAVMEHSGELPDDVQRARQIYRDSEKEFDEKREVQYSEIFDILGNFSGRILVVPGNWDTRTYFDHFGDDVVNIHRYPEVVNGVKFAGYGGAREKPFHVPLRRVVDFSDDDLYKFLDKEDPDVAVTHVPPRHLFDQTKDCRHIGSWANLLYMREQVPRVLLCGHSHCQDSVKDERVATVISNAGNLGRYRSSDTYGTFNIVELEDDGVRVVKSCL